MRRARRLVVRGDRRLAARGGAGAAATERSAGVDRRSLTTRASVYGPLATTIVLTSALGTIGSGMLAERFGRRAVIVGFPTL